MAQADPKMPIELTLGETIVVLRGRRRMSRGQLSVAAGIPVRTLIRYEADERDMPVSALARIARALEASPNDLLRWAAEPAAIVAGATRAEFNGWDPPPAGAHHLPLVDLAA